ncbi:hypothetical protein [Noviherbaspirillum malthae]|uniref:hypothetical protein n=1 Tax=Noviherbaspirillum malthae TaxID=1260987 RepID=UPI00188EA5AD|nr:hypothetical protein [Noviherbaspirillum malthae]
MSSSDLSDSISLGLARLQFLGARREYYEDFAEALEDNDEPKSIIARNADKAERRKDVMGSLYKLWLHRMEDRSFVEALTGTVPTLDQMILNSSDSANSLVRGLRFLCLAIDASRQMSGAIFGALAMPVILVIAFIAMLLTFAFMLVPLLLRMLPPAEWPPLGKLVYSLSMYVTHYGVHTAIVIVAAVIAFFLSLSRWRAGPVRKWCDRYVLPYTIYRDYMGSLFLVSLAALMENDVDLSSALEVLHENSNPWLQSHIEEIQHRLYSESENPGVAFDTGIFNRKITERVIQFGKRSSFQSAVAKVGLRSIDKSARFVAKSAKLLNGLLLVFCGIFLVVMFAGAVTTVQQVQASKKAQMYR